jgi:hypothetical protein
MKLKIYNDELTLFKDDIDQRLLEMMIMLAGKTRKHVKLYKIEI